MIKKFNYSNTINFILFISIVIISLILILNRGYFSHDELQLIGKINNGSDKLFNFDIFNNVFQRPISRNFEIFILYLFGNIPQITHIISLLILSLNSYLLFQLLCNLNFNKELSYLSSLLFLVSPLSLFSVAWFMGIEDQFYILFTLLGLLLFLKYIESNLKIKFIFLFCSLLFLMLSFYSKETGIVFVFYLLVYIIYTKNFTNKYVMFGFLSVVILTSIYLIIKFNYTNINIVSSSSGYLLNLSIFNILKNFIIYFGFPFNFSIVDAAGFNNLINYKLFISIIFHIILLYLFYRIFNLKLLSLYLVLFIITLLPVLIISKQEGQYLYGTSIIFSVFVSSLLIKSKNKILMIIILIILIFHSFKISLYYNQTGAIQYNLINSFKFLFHKECKEEYNLNFSVYFEENSWDWIFKRTFHETEQFFDCKIKKINLLNFDEIDLNTFIFTKSGILVSQKEYFSNKTMSEIPLKIKENYLNNYDNFPKESYIKIEKDNILNKNLLLDGFIFEKEQVWVKPISKVLLYSDSLNKKLILKGYIPNIELYDEKKFVLKLKINNREKFQSFEKELFNEGFFLLTFPLDELEIKENNFLFLEIYTSKIKNADDVRNLSFILNEMELR